MSRVREVGRERGGGRAMVRVGRGPVVDGRPSEVIQVGASAQDHVAAYLEYRNIVGDADGGELLTPEQYERFKREAIIKRRNRLYVSWRNVRTGQDCRAVGPSTKCFCTHRYRQHATDNVADKNVHCKVRGCPCAMFDYIPVRGSGDVRCHCKHSFEDHKVTGHKLCQQRGCLCAGWKTSMGCSCGESAEVHRTVFETRAERVRGGRNVDNLGGGGAGYEALGGITSFSDMLDGGPAGALLGGPRDTRDMGVGTSTEPAAAPSSALPAFDSKTILRLFHTPHDLPVTHARQQRLAALGGPGAGGGSQVVSKYAQPHDYFAPASFTSSKKERELRAMRRALGDYRENDSSDEEGASRAAGGREDPVADAARAAVKKTPALIRDEGGRQPWLAGASVEELEQQLRDPQAKWSTAQKFALRKKIREIKAAAIRARRQATKRDKELDAMRQALGGM